MSPPLPTILLVAAYAVTEYGVPQTPGQPIRLKGAFWRAGGFLALAGALIAPWLTPVSIALLGVVAIIRELSRSGVAWLDNRIPNHQLYWQSVLLGMHLLLLLSWLKICGEQLARDAPTGFRRVLVEPLLGSTLLELTGLIVAVGGGTVFIRTLLSQIGRPREADSHSQQASSFPDEEEIRMGRIIGNLERVLIFVLALNGQLDAIGLVLAAKSLARFKELEDKRFSEYYLLGTLSSTLFALFAAWLTAAATDAFYPGAHGILTSVL
ncbi:MAG: hypothetical protein AAGC60_09070 [Acidobacteriota bacterium]